MYEPELVVTTHHAQCPIAMLDWSLHVKCPKCGNLIDLADTDSDFIVANALFSNKWDALRGYEVDCNKCNHEFQLDRVEY